MQLDEWTVRRFLLYFRFYFPLQSTELIDIKYTLYYKLLRYEVFFLLFENFLFKYNKEEIDAILPHDVNKSISSN